ncbi:hypothetical protein ACFFJY_03010 [Fictibacillus aquaticus]|uniref:DUF4251 domain-containing protein n=1 Tax=Fictibacillus aquaticus TaxID=2021314 RepID=A0A235F8S2_9BACL|nr:hypothetical protein [Fictibacillus aquaticus]OYD57668.1 hypothetical protein CGZ90_13465 [Fictibacillus aquaticus]
MNQIGAYVLSIVLLFVLIIPSVLSRQEAQSVEKSADKFAFTLPVNVESVESLMEKKNPLVQNNLKAFTSEYKNWKLQFDIDLEEDKKIKQQGFTYFPEAKISGYMQNGNEKLNLTGSGYVNRFSFEGRQLYVGYMVAAIPGLTASPNHKVSFRFDNESGEIDVSLMTGTQPDTAFLPFGKIFLFDMDYNAIGKRMLE